MKTIGSLLATGAMATVLPASGADLKPRPLTGQLIDAACYIRADGSLGDSYKSCRADFDKNGKPITFALLTAEGDVYVLVSQKGPQKGQTFEGFRLGDQVQLNGMRTIMVGGIRKAK